MIDPNKVHDQILLFKQKLAPSQYQKDALELATKETLKKLVATAKETGQPLERVFLTSICGEIKTKQQQAEFAARLILMDLLL
jgi:hypothetical protein